ncbi:hypothetical protein ACIOD1_12870 [Streptomyces sp. NPDC088097]|uniref:hypothetical protein n=1 Tax=Streptomyces sp. NPDC088097 TaxID=3365823 RepID=UPI0037F6BEB1
MTTLPPFSGDEPTCGKCGWTGASTEYLPMGDCVHGPGDRSVTLGWTANERLHRECQRCRYQWDEAIAERANQSSAAAACSICQGRVLPSPYTCNHEATP